MKSTANIFDSVLRFSIPLLLMSALIMLFGFNQLRAKNIKLDEKLENRSLVVESQQTALSAISAEFNKFQ